MTTEPPSLAAGEATDKGSLNARAVVRRRAGVVEDLHAAQPPAAVIVAGREDHRRSLPTAARSSPALPPGSGVRRRMRCTRAGHACYATTATATAPNVSRARSAGLPPPVTSPMRAR